MNGSTAGGETRTEKAVSARGSTGAAALRWWRTYCDPNGDADPGVRARLRRARSRLDALGEPATIALVRRLAPEVGWLNDLRLESTIDLARVLAHVKEHDSESVMRLAGWRSFPYDRNESETGDQRPRLSEVRFRRLMATRGAEDQYSAFVRLLALLDGRANIVRLAEDYLDWNHPIRGERIRERWAFDYFGAGIAAPTFHSDEEAEE